MDIVCVSVLLGMSICCETKWRLTHSVRASERAREGRVTVARCTLEMMNSVVLLTHTPGLADAEQLASALPGIFAQMSHSIGCVCVPARGRHLRATGRNYEFCGARIHFVTCHAHTDICWSVPLGRQRWWRQRHNERILRMLHIWQTYIILVMVCGVTEHVYYAPQGC